ncbi:hypothetical protein SAMN05444397_102596 [Flavobacterium aquidurense]|uniref:TonB-dependent outer membrane receptor, SusC/RagA subfamily, signature region n=1 Tax=Flavobacterium frigidimaris TaxID=262320 RepID=A0ABX4BNE2_FLAFR|nr:hypothetical protein [Flavobacterium frigidimaris]OXA77528.1 hypothetical protein B0A65_15850 [Flavobacterium frigidimaris]SDY90949.1 hypothetical protein SAMN05444397_102596 [Flavobacterium aquidurense]
MDNQDKIFDKFKEAAHNSEQKEFPGMEKVWARVEEKLDKKEDKKAISLWKKIAIAASLLLLISLGVQFFKSDQKTTIPASEVVVNETEKEVIQNSEIKKDGVVVEDSKLVPKAEAVKILDNQIKKQQTTVANNEQITVTEAVGAGTVISAPVYEEANAPISESVHSGYVNDDENSVAKDKVADFGYSKKAEREAFSAKAAGQQAEQAKKTTPLVILNGKAMSHSNDAKRDEMMQAELPNLQPENVESLVVLDEPLYIIDGVYYSENDLFGDNPTSPYAPLNKQEIKTITILQDTEAVAKYGEKGKKGVVIITTKTGKPSSKK